MKTLLAIGFGSFLGGICRYVISKIVQTKIVSGFPIATLSVNIIGCLAIGIVFAFANKGSLTQNWVLFFTSGILGGFTTFSAFSNETFIMLREGNPWFF